MEHEIISFLKSCMLLTDIAWRWGPTFWASSSGEFMIYLVICNMSILDLVIQRGLFANKLGFHFGRKCIFSKREKITMVIEVHYRNHELCSAISSKEDTELWVVNTRCIIVHLTSCDTVCQYFLLGVHLIDTSFQEYEKDAIINETWAQCILTWMVCCLSSLY